MQQSLVFELLAAFSKRGDHLTSSVIETTNEHLTFAKQHLKDLSSLYFLHCLNIHCSISVYMNLNNPFVIGLAAHDTTSIGMNWPNQIKT